MPAPDPDGRPDHRRRARSSPLLADARRDQLRLGLVPDAAQARGPVGLLHDRCTASATGSPSRPVEPAELAEIDAAEVAGTLGQDPDHELMALFAGSLQRPRRARRADARGRFAAVVDAAGQLGRRARRAAGRLGLLRRQLASTTTSPCRSSSARRSPPPTSPAPAWRAFADLDRLTMFADNLVPHVLRLDGVLALRPRSSLARIEREELIEHDSPRRSRSAPARCTRSS